MKQKKQEPSDLRRYITIWTMPLVILSVGLLWDGHWRSHPEVNIPAILILILFFANFVIMTLLSMRIKKYIPLIMINYALQAFVTFIVSIMSFIAVTGNVI